MLNIRAETAHAQAEWARKAVDAWDKLYERIVEESKAGHFRLVFDEENERVRFVEDRKEVKAILEQLGYSVDYRRVRDDDDWYGKTYHNRYTIEW